MNDLGKNPSDPQAQPSKLSDEEVAAIRRDPPHYMSLAEAAAYIGCSPRKLRYDTKARLIPVIKLRGKLLFRRAALDEALRKLEIKSV